MARAPKKAKETRRIHVHVLVNRAERKEIAEKALQEGMKDTTWARHVLLKAARK